MKNSPPWLKERRNYSHGNEFPYQTTGPILFASLRAKRMGDLLQSPFITITIICRIRENQMVYEFNIHKLGYLVEILC